jgi:cytochrome c553
MKRALALAALLLCVQANNAAEPSKAEAAKADTVKGQAIAAKVCVACHGTDGNSPAPVNPKLAGQFPEYLQKQLNNFKQVNGKAERPNPVMMGFASALTPEDVRNVAAYYAGQQAKPGTARNKDTIALGQKLWRGGDVSRNVPACASCHGATGGGMPIQYPRLAGQHAEYVEAQLKAFRVGERANDANRMMRAVAAKLTDAEIKAVADYVAGLK